MTLKSVPSPIFNLKLMTLDDAVGLREKYYLFLYLNTNITILKCLQIVCFEALMILKSLDAQICGAVASRREYHQLLNFVLFRPINRIAELPYFKFQIIVCCVTTTRPTM